MSSQVVPVNPENKTVVVRPSPEQVTVIENPDDVVVSREEGKQGPSGPEGPPGPTGPRGFPGVSGEGGYYVHTQATPEQVWVINHELGYVPAFLVVDSAGTSVEGDVLEFTNLTLTLTFSGAFSGTAYLS